MTIAYGVRAFQLVGMPGWSNTAYYDITAKPAAGSSATRDETPLMLQALLIDRFKLRFRRENRALDGYAVVRVRRDALGPAMKPSDVDCDHTRAARPCRSATDAGSTFVASRASLWSLQQRLIAEVNAPIADDTGLTGTYDFDLRWSPDPTTNSEHPSLFTALQEQLGLKLERRRVTVDVLVVDRFERPSVN